MTFQIVMGTVRKIKMESQPEDKCVTFDRGFQESPCEEVKFEQRVK